MSSQRGRNNQVAGHYSLNKPAVPQPVETTQSATKTKTHVLAKPERGTNYRSEVLLLLHRTGSCEALMEGESVLQIVWCLEALALSSKSLSTL